MRRVAVIGSGSWGTAACTLLARHADEVSLWARRDEVATAINDIRRNPTHLPDLELPGCVRASSALDVALRDAEAAVLAVPSAHLREVCRQLVGLVSPQLPILVLTKGIERTTGMLMADLVASELGNIGRVAVLSGPNHAEEIAGGKVSAAVIAASDQRTAELFRSLFVSASFRAYASSDVVGVEVCGAIKNVIAIACGMALGLDAGDNTLAVLMTRGLAEMGRFVVALGGDPLTGMGLAGMGDLVATCTSRHSRNRSFGEAFARRGETLSSFEARTHMVVEGAEAAASAKELSTGRGIEAPICYAVYGLLYGGMELSDAIGSLLDRVPHDEFYGIA